jgi:hypothetical protein
MPEQNPLDRMADELAEWADNISTRIAQSVKGGFNAPGAAQLSERQKLDFYSRQLFGPDGRPNDAGRAQMMQRLGPLGFAEVYDAVTAAHPEFAPTAPQPLVPGYRGPDGLPGTDIAPDGLPMRGAPVAAAPTQSIPMPSGPIAPDGLPTRV